MTDLAKPLNNDLLLNIINMASQIPGAKVDREQFLRSQYKSMSSDLIEMIIEKGPVEAGISKDELKKRAQRIVQDKTLRSSGASFIAGIPGGLAMAATVPLDMLQFYGVAFAMAQEIAYLYGEQDLWTRDYSEGDSVTNQLILYLGAMLGVKGAVQAVRVMAAALAKQALKKIPQQALTKTFIYPIVKSVAKAFGAKMTKSVFAKGVSKAIPFVGGVISGGVTLLTMQPMGMRLVDTFEDAKYSYDQADFEADWEVIIEESKDEEENETIQVNDELSQPAVSSTSSMFEEINKARLLFEQGVISESEFTDMKLKIIQSK